MLEKQPPAQHVELEDHLLDLQPRNLRDVPVDQEMPHLMLLYTEQATERRPPGARRMTKYDR